MKHKLFLPLFVIILASMACQIGAPPVDTEATVAAAIQATKDAEPTATSTPSPAPTETPIPTETPVPTETLSATETPTLTPLPTGAVTSEAAIADWTRYDFWADGFSVSLPDSWQQLTTDPETMDAIMQAAGENNENLDEVLSTQYMQTLLTQGIKMMALEISTDSLTSDLVTNFNVLSIELPIALSLDSVIDVTLAQLEQVFTLTSPIEHERLVLGPDELEAEKLFYPLEQIGGSGEPVLAKAVQYIILVKKTQYVLTFIGTTDHMETVLTEIDQIAQTFELIEP